MQIQGRSWWESSLTFHTFILMEGRRWLSQVVFTERLCDWRKFLRSEIRETQIKESQRWSWMRCVTREGKLAWSIHEMLHGKRSITQSSWTSFQGSCTLDMSRVFRVIWWFVNFKVRFVYFGKSCVATRISWCSSSSSSDRSQVIIQLHSMCPHVTMHVSIGCESHVTDSTLEGSLSRMNQHVSIKRTGRT